MAYLVEKHYSLAIVNSPAYPYNILELLFNDIALKGRIAHQIVMIYLSLQSSFPDIQFRNIYESVIGNKLYEKSNVNDFAASIINELSYHFNDGVKSQIERLKQIIGQMCNLLSLYPLSSSGVNWLANVSNTFFNSVITNPLKYIKPILDRKGINDIFKLLDTNYFLITDKSSKLSAVKKTANDDNAGIMFISNVFHFIDYMLFYNKGDDDYDERICPMYYSCNLGLFKSVDCESKPFTKGIKKINSSLCNYGSVAHMFFVHEIPVEII